MAEILENVYAARVAVLGENHPRTLTTMGNLVDTLSRMGRRNEAQALLAKLRKLQKK